MTPAHMQRGGRGRLIKMLFITNKTMYMCKYDWPERHGRWPMRVTDHRGPILPDCPHYSNWCTTLTALLGNALMAVGIDHAPLTTSTRVHFLRVARRRFGLNLDSRRGLTTE